MQLIYIYEVALKLLPNPTTSHEPYYTDTSIRTPWNIVEGRNTTHDRHMTQHMTQHIECGGRTRYDMGTIPMVVRV
jgi:hypothetical protein